MARRPGRVADRPGADRRVRAGLGRVRARGHARPRRQRRDRLLDRERRPDGRPHRRLGHRRAADDAHRPHLPAPARPGDRGHPRGGGGDGRLQRPVRGRARHGRDPRDRDEPARVALQRAGLQGHRLPDRQDRRPARGRLPAGRDPQRHHPAHARLLRAGDRLRGGQVAALRLREVPGHRQRPLDPHEVGRRGDGDRAHVRPGVRQGAALARARRAERALARDRRRPARPARAPAGGPLRRDPRAAGAAAPTRARCTSAPASTRGSCASCAPWRRTPTRSSPASGLLPRRGHLRRRVRGRDAVLLLRLGARPRPPRDRARRAARGDDPRLGPQPHRPGDRVRLLLRARRDDGARLRPRRGDGQLQPGDRLDRLRHVRPAVLRAAHARGRARDRRGRAARRA